MTKKIWIDLDNSPHVLFFAPIIKELRKRGILVVVSSRDYAQVSQLAHLFGIDNTRIGRHYGKNKWKKAMGLLIRSLQMIPFYLRERPDLVFSHGSRSMILVARLFGVPVMGATDYEHTRHLPFITPLVMLLPEVIPDEAVKGFGKTIVRYPGLKEDVYVPEFRPDGGALKDLHLGDGSLVVTVRPPATAAHYHTRKSDRLFQSVMKYLTGAADVKIVMVCRTAVQEGEIRREWADAIANKRMILPENAVNGLNLIWHSDLVISGGGTMIREAAALGVPAYSIFGGKIGAVDRYLEKNKRIAIIRSAGDIRTKIKLAHREKGSRMHEMRGKTTLNSIVDEVEKFLVSA